MPLFSRSQILSGFISACLTLVHVYVCKAQFTDNFSDGDFSTNPTWSGNDTRFSIETGLLRLTAPVAPDVSYLSTPSGSIDNAVWEFYARMNFNPSNANYTDIYLVSDNPVLTGSLSGYFVRLGNTSDEVSLYKQTGTTKTEIISGTDPKLSTPNTAVKIKVTRDGLGNWELFADVSGSYVSEGTVNDVTQTASSFFGIVCVYTMTNSQNFFFDDFVIMGDPFIDPSQPADYKDVIITEIFPDPSPVIGLPEAEFIEIHNRSEKIINLGGWKFTDGSSTATLSGFFEPGEYKIITATGSALLFTSFGSVLGVANFPTLNNSSDNLELRRSDDLLVDNVSYADAWYQDEDKKQGGFTLELIDPANPCGEGDNWIAAESSTGGTPGTQNSVFENKPDLTGPKLISAVPLSATTLFVKFNEKLEAEEPARNSFAIVPEIAINNLVFTDASLTTLTVTLGQDLQTGTLYSIGAQNVRDCNGNVIQSEFSAAEFALPETASEKDILINEILFNPRPTGADFLEVYNTSDKYINLKNWSVANYVNEEIINPKPITTEDILISPHTYLVFTEDKDVVKGEYVQAAEERLFTVAALPSFNDDEGTVALIDPSNAIIDFFSYTDDYHAVFLKNDEGVSLERISSSALTNDAANWQSASSTVGYATPGYLNSNARGEMLADKVEIEPEIFEPITGQPAFTQIHYNFTSVGYVANVKILDYHGREIKQLANNATLATSGFFRWDGDMNDGTKARTGYYIVWVEVFNSKGKVDSFRKKVVVASRFK